MLLTEPALVFVPLTRRIPSTARITCSTLAAARLATTLHRGGYDGLRAAEARLDGWLGATGLRRSGPIRLRYLQFGADRSLRLPAAYLVDAARDYLTEIQVPVASA